MKKVLLLAITLACLLVYGAGFASACGYQDHDDCDIEKTIVEGRIYYEGTNEPAGNAEVTITCMHENASNVKTTSSINSGLFKGGYFVIFPQTQCISGDEVIVSAVAKDGSSGSNSGEVKDWLSKRCLDIDVGIVNVPLIPEFGAVIGILTGFSAVGIFLFVRKNHTIINLNRTEEK